MYKVYKTAIRKHDVNIENEKLNNSRVPRVKE